VKARTIRAGRLRNPVSIQQRTTATDSEGNSTTTWQTVGRTFAEIQPLSTQERLQAAQLEQDLTHTVLLRYADSLYPGVVNHEARLVLDANRVLDIRTVVNVDESNRVLQLSCYEREV
jgi:SPP1 family predicted phage head-tail adaptor